MPNLMNPFVNSISLDDLNPEFAERVDTLIKTVAGHGLRTLIMSTLRGPGIQAKMWCGTRTPEVVRAARNRLIAAGALKLSSYLKEEFALTNPLIHVWNLPGNTWHHWGMAIDMILIGPDGVTLSSSEGGSNMILFSNATRLGIGHHTGLKSSLTRYHFQADKTQSPMSGLKFSWGEVELELAKIYDL